MSITLELSPEIEKQLAAMSDEERAQFVASAIAEKLEIDPARLTPEDEAGLDEAYTAIEEGRMHRFDPAAAREKAKRLLEAA